MRLKLPILFAFIFTFSITSTSTTAQEKNTSCKDTTQLKIKGLIENVIAEQGLIGTQAAIWYDGKLILSESWGSANKAFSVPVTSETRFLIASITKSITGLAILKLEKQGLIDLDKPIQTYLPEFPKKHGPAITTRLLIQHRSGIRNYRRGETTNGSFFDTNYETAIASLEKFANDSLVAVPGESVQYSSFGYAVLASIIEKISGEPFKEHINKTILEPFKMNTTIAPDWRYSVKNLASSYGYFLGHLGLSSLDDEPFEARRLNYSYNPGGGNLVSTSLDLIEYGKNLLLDRNSIEKILDVSQDYPTTYGWLISRDHSDRVVIHSTGASEAYQGSITIWPEHNLVAVALSNTWGKNSRRGGFTLSMHQDIAELIIKD